MFTVNRPEVAGLHLATTAQAGLDRGLVHRDDAAGTDRIELRRVDGFEQLCRLLHQLCQPRPAGLEAGLLQALVLAVQRQVPAELVQQHASNEADVGTAALDDARRRARTVQGLCVAALDHRAHVLEHDKAARALRQTVADLLTDDLVLLGRQTLCLRVGDLNDLHRHLGLVEERRRRCPLMGGNDLGGVVLIARRCQIAQQLSEVHLLRIDRSHKALALVAEDLALEPLDLAFELLDLRGLALQQLRYLPRPERGHRGGIWNSGLQCQGHGPHVTEDACGTAEDCPQLRGQR